MEGSELFGKAFEHFILLEVRAFLSYTRKNIKMCYWRSTSQYEVDLIKDNQWGIEIKSAASIQDKHLKGIRALKEEGIILNFAGRNEIGFLVKSYQTVAEFFEYVAVEFPVLDVIFEKF